MVSFVYRLLRPFNELVNLMKGLHRATLESSVSSLELECIELEVTLLYMILGSLMGALPIPSTLALELLPTLKNEFKLLELRSVRGSDIGSLMASLGGEW